ncbi:hypothetical protein PG991_010723 [Apiospora marii]|uniref:DUF1275 domain protein n=1 Tax=Apiospora marii TaxID=335849 RepID=A0ABR1RC28_9PEZI
MPQEPILPTSHETSATASVRSSTDPDAAMKRPSFFASLRDDIDLDYADIPICLCSLVSGLCDSTAFNASAVFVSMQTGNTIFLALGASSLPRGAPLMWLKALCSILAFLLGVLVFSQTRAVRPRAKRTLAASFLAQALLIWAAAALAQGGAAPAFGSLDLAEAMQRDGVLDLRALGPIMLLAFQFGGQIVTTRLLGFNEVPTNVLTSVYCDLMSDPLLLAPWRANPKRNRRASAVVLMLVGGVCGGWLSRTRAGMGVALWVAGAVKFGIAVAWVAWTGKKPQAVGAEKV